MTAMGLGADPRVRRRIGKGRRATRGVFRPNIEGIPGTRDLEGPWAWCGWSFPWDAVAGEHVLCARATDETGETQTSRVAGVLPDGATGYDQIQVDVG